jgi:hypothetical protein
VYFAAIDAIFSTYILGLTDGATVWSLSVARTGVLAIQWPYYIPFTAAFSSQSLLFGQWSGDETATTIQVRKLLPMLEGLAVGLCPV